MQLTSFLVAAALAPSALALEGPETIGELTKLAYPDSAPIDFTPLPHFTQVAIAGNDSAILQVSDLRVSHYPLKKGHITFALNHMLTQEVPVDSQIEIVSFVGNELLFNGTLPICDYLVYAKLHCPLEAYKHPKITKHVLQVPEEAGDGRLSFIAKVKTPSNQLILHLAGIIDLVNDGTVAQEEQVDVQHDEL